MDISKWLKECRTRQKLTQEKVATQLGVTKQAYHNYEQKHRLWKLEDIVDLSAILDFEVIIREGECYIKERTPMDLIYANEFEKISFKNNEYEVIERYASYSLVQLYTDSENWSDDVLSGDILETCMVYPSYSAYLEDYPHYPDCQPTNVRLCYGLVDNETGELLNTGWADPHGKIENLKTMYYLHLAPTLSYTEDNYPIIYEDETQRIVRAYGEFWVANQRAICIDVSPCAEMLPEARCLFGFLILNKDSSRVEKHHPFAMKFPII